MQFGIIGSGTWATALAKILTDNKIQINWCVRTEKIVQHINSRRHNPQYLSSVHFDTSLVKLSTNIEEIISASEYIVVAIPSAYLAESFEPVQSDGLTGKKIISAVKGILPESNQLFNQYLGNKFGLPVEDYFTLMGPCHAEEVASEKLSYLTFSGINDAECEKIAAAFRTPYMNTTVNSDIYGVQYAAVMKNIYALGAGIAHGLEYGDNFLSVLIANCADEMAVFLKKVGIQHIEVGVHEEADPVTHRKTPNYAASVYLGDLLVTCYSLYSRNRTFGNMIGKGYSVRAAQLEMNMVAEGYNASKCLYLVNKAIGAEMPIAGTIYQILWENVKPLDGFNQIEKVLV